MTKSYLRTKTKHPEGKKDNTVLGPWTNTIKQYLPISSLSMILIFDLELYFILLYIQGESFQTNILVVLHKQSCTNPLYVKNELSLFLIFIFRFTSIRWN
jgi:hypothetical protein